MLYCPAATPVDGQQVPKVLLGFNNWKIKLDPLPMKHSSIQVGLGSWLGLYTCV